VFSLVISAVSMALPAFAAERRAAAPLLLGSRRPPLSIDISCPHGAQQQTRRTLVLQSNNGTYRRTDTRPLHRPRYAYYAGGANKQAKRLSIWLFLVKIRRTEFIESISNDTKIEKYIL